MFCSSALLFLPAPFLAPPLFIRLSIIEKNDQSFLKKASEDLIQSRPTAINLKWAVDRMMKKLSGVNSTDILKIAINEAKAICEEDVDFCKNIGLNGLKIIEEISKKKKDTVNILTHCNAGWLATINWGTATSPIYHAHKKGIPVHVWVDETRPRNQGANLTSYELNEEKIPNTIIADNTGGILMQRGEVDLSLIVLNELVNKYPKSEYAKLARMEIKRAEIYQ